MRKTRQRSRFYQNRLASSLQGVFIIKKVYGHKGGRASESHATRGYGHRPNGGSESLRRITKRPASPATQWAIQHSRPTAHLRHSSDLRLSDTSLSHYIYELSLAVNAKLFVYAFHMGPNRVMRYEQPLARLRHCVSARQQVNNFYFPQRQSVRFLHPFKTRTFLLRRLRRFRQCGRLSHCGKKDGAPDKGNRHSKCERNSNQAAGTKINLREQSIKGGFRKRSRV